MHQNERHTWHNADGRASFGDLLRRLRAARGLSQEELAQRAGLSAHGISDLERGARTRPYPDTVRRLAFALHLTEEARVEFHSFARGAGLANAPGTAPEQPLSHRPEPLTSFIGRARELEQVADLLAREESPARLVTLVGPAGVGKTRLAIGTVGNLGPKYAGRTWFVPLASIRDPLLVPQAIAQELGLRESTHEGLVERVIRYLGAAPGLLVLDNFEQILAAATLVRRLLSECSELSILITSRAPLRLYGEHEFLVPALAVPDRSGDPGVERLSQVEAVRLFLERTQAVHSGLSLTEETAPVVAEICRRLEGLPLAIELAAARTKVLSPHALLARLGDQLSLLTTGSADLPVRQRTLRATLDWSYELLSPGQQRWFRRLSVFAGGCRLETAEAVCADQEGADALDALSALVDQSLLYVEYDADGEPRFQMLEFVHEFAWERLLASPEFRLMRERHAHEFVRLAEEADSELRGPGQSGWRDRLQRELPNLRAALRWALDGGDLEAGLRAAASLWMFWFVRGYLAEGRHWLEALLRAPGADQPKAARAKALFTAGILAFYQRDYETGRRWHQEELALERDLGERAGIADALFGLAQSTYGLGDLSAARSLHEEALAVRRELGDVWKVALSLCNLGLVVQDLGEQESARSLLEESLALRRALGDRRGTGGVLVLLGRLVQTRGEHQLARSLYSEALAIIRELGDQWSLTHLLAALVGLMADESRWQLALSIGRAAAAVSRSSGTGLFPGRLERMEADVERARRELGHHDPMVQPKELDQSEVDQLLAEALTVRVPARSSVDDGAPLGTHASLSSALTRREREVVRLIALGYTNREMAAALTITERTAAAHVEHILRKLDMTSRAQIAAWVASGLAGSSADLPMTHSAAPD